MAEKGRSEYRVDQQPRLFSTLTHGERRVLS